MQLEQLDLVVQVDGLWKTTWADSGVCNCRIRLAKSSAEEEQARESELLREENLRQQQLWQTERSHLLTDLSQHQERINWLEKGVPPMSSGE